VEYEAGDAAESGLSSDRRVVGLKRRLVREAMIAVSMLESAVQALWTLDTDAATAVRLTDDRVDNEEVEIEQECYAILALYHPFAREFRIITFVLKVNADIERVADHASSIAKVASKISKLNCPTPVWPTSLVELSQRVPAMCHELLRAVLDEDTDAARRLVVSDETIDQLDRRLFEETTDMLKRDRSDAGVMVAMYIYRVGRELERIGDLMANIAEDVVYLTTGEIIRHAKRRPRTPKAPG